MALMLNTKQNTNNCTDDINEECDGKKVNLSQATTSTAEKPRYIPPHLRGKGIKKFSNEKNNYNDNNNKTEINWYSDEEEFESKLGVSLSSFKLNIASYRNNKQLNELTNINKSKANLNRSALFVFGPPAIGKSTIYKKYLFEFGIYDAVNTDGDIVRKTHYGIQEYLKKTNELNIGYYGFFKRYCQHWSANWKFEIRQKAMKQKQNIIAFSTCHKSNECIKEINSFFHNGYHIKILMVCAEFDKCNKMGIQRERLNGRKHISATYNKSIQGSMDVIDYLLKTNKINTKNNDLIIVRNKYKINQQPERFNDDWQNIKHRILIPMKKRAIRQLYNNTT